MGLAWLALIKFFPGCPTAAASFGGGVGLGIILGGLVLQAACTPCLGLLAHANKVGADHDPDGNQDARKDDVVP